MTVPLSWSVLDFFSCNHQTPISSLVTKSEKSVCTMSNIAKLFAILYKARLPVNF